MLIISMLQHGITYEEDKTGGNHRRTQMEKDNLGNGSQSPIGSSGIQK